MNIRIFVAKIIKILLSWTKILPVQKNKILFFSYQGKSYSCNPKYIAEELLFNNDSAGVTIYFALKNPNKYDDVPQKLNLIKYGSLKFFYCFFTSKVIITNSSNLPYLPKKANQVLINTWHGGGAYKSEFYNLKLTNFKNKNVDYFISSSYKFGELLQKSTGLPREKFVNAGMPRNDILINFSQSRADYIKEKLLLESDVKYLLYAPTYRECQGRIIYPDFDDVVQILSERFSGKWKVLVRGHYNVVNEFKAYKHNNVIDVSLYEDMQEILLISDAVITDYSSLIWDYSFLNRPCFLFVPDLGEYTKNRGFYYPLENWGFPYAKNLVELLEIIRQFDINKFTNSMEEHHHSLGSYEDGMASHRVASLILDCIQRGYCK